MGTKRRLPGAFYLILAAAAVLVTAVLVFLAAAGGVRLVDTWPVNGSQDEPITVPIRMAFSHPMDEASIEAHFFIEPEIDGELVVDGKEVKFLPHGALAPGTQYTITLLPGALSQQGRPVGAGRTWRFQTRVPQLLYLGWPTPGADLRQLYSQPLDGRQPADGAPAPHVAPLQLTDHPGGVWDYAVHPQGEAVVYSVLREDGGTDLWRMDRDGSEQRLLLACPKAACLSLAWSSDGRQLAYERRDIRADGPNLDAGASRIWLLDLKRGRERPLFDYDVALHSPVWAPEGERLAYVSPIIPGVEVYDLQTRELQQFGNQWGAAPVWSPDGRHLVLPELMLAGEALIVHLVRIDQQSQALRDISGDGEHVKDTSPAWSPGGGWIAFGRQLLSDEHWTPGRQPWLARPDGSGAYALPVDTPMADHFAFAWRPDGDALAYSRTDLSAGPQPVPDVSVWIFDFVSREPIFVAGDGVLPGWLP